MKPSSLPRAALALCLSFCLCLPTMTVVAGGKNGKKNFKEGVKHENTEQWDLAAQQYALAVADEPDNAEYRLRLVRAMQMASLMFAARGDLLAARGDYAGAYNAYARASTYDSSNETMRTKMARMIEQQKAQIGLGETASYNPRTGNPIPTSNEIRTPPARARSEAMQRIEFNEGASLKVVINTLARQLNLNVVFDESFKDTNKFSLLLNDVSPAKAFDILLQQTKHIFELMDRRTIMIYADNPPNRQRVERLLVKTFYLSNADLNETRAIVQANLGSQRQVNVSKQLNALVVRATPAELAVAQSLIDSLDKNRSEVVIDVDIYEVSNSTSLEIGNQIATSGLTTTKTTYDSDGNPVTVTTGTSASLSNLGGLGRATVSALAGNIFGLGGGLGTVIGLPPSSLSLLQSKGKSRLLASTQVHAQDGEQNQTVVGRSVPIRTGTNYLSGTSTTTSTNNNNYSFDNIQYRDVGLVIDVTPTITNEGYVQVKMKLESSNVEATGTDSYLTPTFTKRSLTTISRIQDGVAAVVACVKQDSKGNSRASIPIVGMMPILGRLFSAPKETSSQSDIVITVTPHIIRAPEITPDDHLAHLSGTQQAGATQTIEEVVYRAQTEEDQERRAIARRSTPPAGELHVEAASRVVFPVTPTPSDPVETQPASLAEEVPAATLRNAPRAEVVPAVRPVTSPATPHVPPQKNN